MRLTRTKLGPLQCTCVDADMTGAKPSQVVVLCHGVNAPGDDLVGVGEELLQLAPQLAKTTRFYFPAGLHDSAKFGMPGGRAWWEIDWALFAQMMNTGDYAPMHQAHPPGLDQARAALEACLADIFKETGLDASRLALGGFSQGAMLATDTVLRMKSNPAALVAFSGSPLCENEWRELAPAHKGLRVLQSHGRQDPVLPFEGGEKLRDLLAQSGANVEFVPFNGQHGIAFEVIQKLAQLLEREGAK